MKLYIDYLSILKFFINSLNVAYLVLYFIWEKTTVM